MATFQVSKKNKNKTTKNLKVIFGWVIIAISTFMFLFSATKILPFLRYFLLGVFGVFVYPLSILGFIIALALLNDKRYVMPKKYAIFLSLSLYLFLCIIQLIVIGSPKDLSYGNYLALNYTKQFTPGGILIGFLPTSMAALMGAAATYILLSIAFAVCVAFFVEAVISLRKTSDANKPIKLQIKKESIDKPVNPRESQVDSNPIVAKNKEEINVMYDGNVAKEEQRELTAREKLGLVGGNKQQIGQPYTPREIIFPEETKKSEDKVPSGMSIREYLLSPPRVDMDKFREQQARTRRFDNNQQQTSNFESNINTSNISSSEITQNLEELKQEEILPQSIIEEEPTIRQSNLPEIKPEEITNEAEDIIRSVVMQEKIERENLRVEDNKDYINFDDIEINGSSQSEEEKPNELQQEEN